VSDILAYAFMQRALVAAILVGLVCSVIGTYVVLKRLAFAGAGIAHSAFGGVALGYLLGLSPIGIAIPFSLGTAMAIGWVSRKGRIPEDTAIGIFFASAMALGVLFIGLKEGYNVDLFGYLFGSILAVSLSDIWLILGLGIGVITIVLLLFKEFFFMSFDEEMAAVSGLPVQALYFILLGLVALTVIISVKLVGIILVEALLVIPAAAAFQLTRSFGRMMLIAVLVGVLSGVLGLFLSYWWDIASGATIVLTATVIFLLCFLFSPKRRRRRVIAKEQTAALSGE
jgi:ABC-type Mn2+/Zn2+ transport system permease subunit